MVKILIVNKRISGVVDHTTITIVNLDSDPRENVTRQFVRCHCVNMLVVTQIITVCQLSQQESCHSLCQNKVITVTRIVTMM